MLAFLHFCLRYNTKITSYCKQKYLSALKMEVEALLQNKVTEGMLKTRAEDFLKA